MSGSPYIDVHGTDTPKSCLKDRLDELGFNWKKGKIMLRLLDGKPSQAGDYLDEGQEFTWQRIDKDDVIIREITAWSNGWNQEGFHYHIIAYDDKKIYYPWEYDGDSGMTWMYLDPKSYLTHIEKYK